jgi:single-strand DNA-binding protein
MAGEPIITIVGNLTNDPELRFTPSGAAVANFTVAITPRKKQGDEWVDDEERTTFYRCTAWRQFAENIAESLQKGQRVIVQGRFTARNWETKEGEKRTSFDLQVDSVGPELRWATAKVSKVAKGGFSQGGPDDDPWSALPRDNQQRTAAAAGGVDGPWSGNGGFGNAFSDEPPF